MGRQTNKQQQAKMNKKEKVISDLLFREFSLSIYMSWLFILKFIVYLFGEIS